MNKYLLFVSVLLFWFAFPQQSKAQSDQTVTNGEATAPIIFQGTACQYGWYVDGPFAPTGPYIGLTAWGTGNIPSFTAINTTNNPITATITGIPELSQYAYVTDSASNDVSVIDTYNEGEITTIPVVKPLGVSLNPAGTFAYVTGAAGISVIKTASSSVIAIIGLAWQAYGVVVSPDGSRLYVVGSDSLAVINIVSNSVITSMKVGGGAHGVSVSPDGSRVFVSNQKDNTVSVIATATNTVLATVPVGASPDGIAVSPDGSLVYVVNHATNQVSVINTTTNLVSATISVGTSPTAVVFAPSGNVAYVSNTGANTVSVINTATNLVIATIAVQSSPTGISINPDGSLVYVANKGSNSVSVINTTTNDIVTNVPVGTAPVAFGNFVIKGTGCAGTVITVHITVNPTPAGQPVINIGPETGSVAACAGNASVSPRLQQFMVTGESLSGGITVTAPAGFELSLTAGSGYAGSLAIGAANNATVYVRSAASDPPGSISGNVVLTAAGAISVEVPVTGTINALPVVDPVTSQTVNNGATTAAVNFTGTGNIYTWVNDTPSIGLAASGTGNIAPFTAINKGVLPVTATITVTPEPAAFAYVGDANGNVSVINTTTNKIVSIIPVGNSLFGASVSPDASTVYISSHHSDFATWNTIAEISTATNTVTGTIEDNYAPLTIITSHDGSLLYVATYEGEDFEVINTITGAVISRVFTGEVPYGLAVTPDGSKAYIGNFDFDTLWVVNIAANAIVKKILVGSRPATLQISPDGSKLFVANTDSGTISVINTTTDAIIATIQVGGTEQSPDGSLGINV
jgi:YVTN family beta-propeller protein